MTDNCNLEFNQTGSMFTSANYHEEYNSSTLCTYRAVAKPGQYIALTFLSFDVEVSPGCIYDAVTVSHIFTFRSLLTIVRSRCFYQPLILSISGLLGILS